MNEKEELISKEALDGISSYLTDERLKEELEKNKEEAREILRSDDKMERFLNHIEVKYNSITQAEKQLPYIPVMTDLVKDYTKGEYINIEKNSVIIIISALLYFLSPIDLMPDSIPVMGYSDDELIIEAALKLVEKDMQNFIMRK